MLSFSSRTDQLFAVCAECPLPIFLDRKSTGSLVIAQQFSCCICLPVYIQNQYSSLCVTKSTSSCCTETILKCSSGRICSLELCVSLLTLHQGKQHSEKQHNDRIARRTSSSAARRLLLMISSSLHLMIWRTVRQRSRLFFFCVEQTHRPPQF